MTTLNDIVDVILGGMTRLETQVLSSISTLRGDVEVIRKRYQRLPSSRI